MQRPSLTRPEIQAVLCACSGSLVEPKSARARRRQTRDPESRGPTESVAPRERCIQLQAASATFGFARTRVNATVPDTYRPPRTSPGASTRGPAAESDAPFSVRERAGTRFPALGSMSPQESRLVYPSLPVASV